MWEERSSKVTGPLVIGTPQRRCARSSNAISSVSTCQDHKATPAASVAIRKRLASHTGGVVLSRDIGGISQSASPNHRGQASLPRTPDALRLKTDQWFA